MTATKLKLAFSALVVAGATTAFVIQHQAQEKLRADNEALTQQLAQLQTNNESLSNRLAAAGDSKSLSDEQFNELLKLRGEVTQLQGKVSQADDPFIRTALEWKAREAKLRKLCNERCNERPDLCIPEMRFLTDRQWLDMARDANLDSEDGIDSALGQLRSQAKFTFTSMLQQALNKYMKANNGNSPTDPAQLKLFFDVPVDDDILQRYYVLNNEETRPAWLEGAIVAEKSNLVIVTSSFMDRAMAVGPQYIGIAPVPEPKRLVFPQSLIPVMQSYQSQNNGQTPTNFSNLKPYVTTPEQEAALEKLIGDMKK